MLQAVRYAAGLDERLRHPAAAKGRRHQSEPGRERFLPGGPGRVHRCPGARPHRGRQLRATSPARRRAIRPHTTAWFPSAPWTSTQTWHGIPTAGRPSIVAAPGGDTTADFNGDAFPDGVLSTCGDDTSVPIRYAYCFFQGTS
ncbi:MAG: hypothetical protein MZV70_08775, partial [Desulfobacterales bacterium]|nr:hypothetical protein [Desulfobacterales bacterium]